jgi:integrase
MKPEDPGFRARPWEVVFTYRKKRYRRSTLTADRVEAEKRARARINAIKDAADEQDFFGLENTRLRRVAHSTLGAIFVVYRQVGRVRRPGANIGSLRSMIRKGQGVDLSDDEIEALPGTVLTKQLVRSYQDAVVPATMADGDAKRTAITTSNSTVRQARSLFKRELVEDGVYKDAGLRLPDLGGFLGARLLKEPAHNFVPIPPDLVESIWSASRTLKTENPNAYRAFLLSICCGLRRAEAARASFDHVVAIRRGADTIQALRLGITKNGQPRLVPLDSAAYAELREMAAAIPMSQATDPAPVSAAPVGFILTGPWTTRDRIAFDDLAAWLTRHGWTRKKKAHELRKHFGSLLAAKYGARVAASILGNTEEVFHKHYDAVLQMPEVDVYGGSEGVDLGVTKTFQSVPHGSIKTKGTNEDDQTQQAAG